MTTKKVRKTHVPHTIDEVEQVLRRDDSTPPYIQRQVERLKQSRTRRAPPSKGWSVVAPRRGKQRRELQNLCGSDCFLQPKELKYPICPQVGLLQKDAAGRRVCAVDCRGLHGAKSRAGRHARHLLPRIEARMKTHDCRTQTKKKAKRRVHQKPGRRAMRRPSIEPDVKRKTKARKRVVQRRLFTPVERGEKV